MAPYMEKHIRARVTQEVCVFLRNKAYAWYGRHVALTLFADFEQ